MSCFNSLTILLLSFFIISADQSLVLTDLKDKNIRCDYLIVSPDSFMQQSVRLASYHYDNPTADVKNPRVVSLNTVYKQFKTTDTTRSFEAIYEALHWAHSNWTLPFTYVVLMGDDSIGTQNGNLKDWNRGPMPSFVNRSILSLCKGDNITNVCDSTFDTTYKWSDIKYTTINDTSNYTTKSLFMIARIPCENSGQCSVYINKVVTFDSQKKQSWKNRTIFLADDDFQGDVIDPISSRNKPHMQYCDRTSDLFFKGFFVSKIYSAFYQVDDKTVHTLARDAYFNAINIGALWTVYFGHGHESFLADERFIQGKDAYRFRNNDKNGVFISFSCENGAYQIPFGESMCKQFLFTPKTGYLVYIASTTQEYANSNEKLARSFFSTRDSLRDKPIGFQWWSSLHPQNLYGNNEGYTFMGDPALYFSENNVPLSISHKDGTNTLHCTPADSTFLQNGLFQARISVLDSVLPLENVFTQLDDMAPFYYEMKTVVDSTSGAFNRGFDIVLKSQYLNKKLEIVVYAWNDTSDARGEFILNNSTPVRHFAGKQDDKKLVTMKGDVVYIDNSWDRISTVLSVYSARGQRVYSESIKNAVNKISLDRLNIGSGLYIVRVLNAKKSIDVRWIKR